MLKLVLKNTTIQIDKKIKNTNTFAHQDKIKKHCLWRSQPKLESKETNRLGKQVNSLKIQRNYTLFEEFLQH